MLRKTVMQSTSWYLKAAAAQALDNELMNPDATGFTIYQLMELAGLAVAQASHLYIR